jgi:AcrR family transcriptional regulator
MNAPLRLTPGTTGAATPKGQATRQIVLSTAIRLVATTGYSATTVQTVLDDAGVSRGSLLHHFPNRDLLMVAAAQETMTRMLAGIQEGLKRHADPLKGMSHYPTILWRVQNDMPARAYTEIQLASRWDAGLGDGLRRAVAEMNDVIVRNMEDLAAHTGLTDVPGLMREVYILISATQGMAINRDLMRDRALAAAALATLRDRFVTALRARMSRETVRAGDAIVPRNKGG